MGYKLIGLAFAAAMYWPFSVVQARDFAGACADLRNALPNHNKSSTNYQAISSVLEERCNTRTWTASTASQEFPDDLSYYLTLTPEQVDLPETAQSKANQDFEQAASLGQKFDICKNHSSKALTDCQASVSQFSQTYSGDYNSLSSRMASATSSSGVENACSAISSFESKANSSSNEAIQSCQRYKSQCPSYCERAQQERSQYRGQIPQDTLDWINVNIRVAEQSCARIDQVIAEAREASQKSVNGLRNQCQQARNRLTEERQQARNEEEDDDSGGQMLRQAGSALQALGQALQQPQMTPSMLPYQQAVTPEMGVNYMGSDGGSYSGVSKGSGYKSNGTLPTDGSLLMNEDPMGFGSREASKKAAMAAPGGGGGGGAPQASTRPAPDAQKNRRGGSRSSTDADVLKGYYGGGGGPGGFRAGGGYPVAPNGVGAAVGRAGRPGGVPSGSGVDLNRFAPKWIVRRHVATSTGPDGITGPHTDLFKKVRARYEANLASLD